MQMFPIRCTKLGVLQWTCITKSVTAGQGPVLKPVSHYTALLSSEDRVALYEENLQVLLPFEPLCQCALNIHSSISKRRVPSQEIKFYPPISTFKVGGDSNSDSDSKGCHFPAGNAKALTQKTRPCLGLTLRDYYKSATQLFRSGFFLWLCRR